MAVVAVPLAYSLWLSFTDVNLLRGGGAAIEMFGMRLPLFRCVGLKNYLQVFADPLYWDSLWRTLYFVGAFVIEATLVGLGMALVLNERFPGRPLMRSLLLVPWSLSRIVVGLLWIGILDFEFGALQRVLHRLGLIDRVIAVLQGRLQRAQRAGVRLHVEPGAVRDAPVPRRHAVDLRGSLRAPPRWTARATGSASAT